MSLGEYNGAGSGTTKLLLHLNGNSTDSSGNSNNGTDTNITYGQANGKFGQGAGFNGSSSQIQIPYTASLQPTNITLSCWVKVGTIVQYGNIISKPYRATGWTAPYRSYGLAQEDTTNKFFTFYTNYNGTGVSISSPNNTVVAGVWTHLIGTFDGSYAKIYLNGTLVNTSALSSGNILYSTNEPLMLGQRSSTSAGEYYNGAIDEVIIENRAWSASEVKKYYTYTKGRFGII